MGRSAVAVRGLESPHGFYWFETWVIALVLIGQIFLSQFTMNVSDFTMDQAKKEKEALFRTNRSCGRVLTL